MKPTNISAVFDEGIAQIAAAAFSVYANSEEARNEVQNVMNSISGRCPTSERIEQGGRDHVAKCFSSEINLRDALCCFPETLSAFAEKQDDVAAIKRLAEHFADTIDYTDY